LVVAIVGLFVCANIFSAFIVDKRLKKDGSYTYYTITGTIEGTDLKTGDILIGKITPKGESDPSPEEKLLRAIFGDKAGDVKDASLKASPSLQGVVVHTTLFSKASKKGKTKLSSKALLPKLEEEYEHKMEELKKVLIDKLLVLTEGKTSAGVKDYTNMEVVPKGAKFTQKVLNDIDFQSVQLSKWTTDTHKNELIRTTVINYLRRHKELDAELKRKRFDFTIGDELPSGIMQIAKVYVAKKGRFRWATKWQVVTVTRVLFPELYVRKTCLSLPTVQRWTSS